MDVIGRAVLFQSTKSIKIVRIYSADQRRHRPSKPLNQPIRNKYDIQYIRDVIYIIALQHARISDDQNVTSPVF